MAPPGLHGPCGVRHGMHQNPGVGGLRRELVPPEDHVPGGKKPESLPRKVRQGYPSGWGRVLGRERHSRHATRTLRKRRISALVLRNLSTTILVSGDDLITLGLLPPAWPNHGEEWGTRTGDFPRTDFPADRNLTEKEVYKNALLTIRLGDNLGQDGHNDNSPGDPMEIDDDTSELYDSKMAIPDSVFDTETDVSLIPGFKESRLPNCIKAICNKYASIFKKSLTTDKRTKFEAGTLPLIKGAKPTRRAKTCQKTPSLEEDYGRDDRLPVESRNDRKNP